MESERWVPPKPCGLMKVRDGHPFGLMQIPKNAKFVQFKWQKTWYTLSIMYSINPPLAKISLVQTGEKDAFLKKAPPKYELECSGDN